MVAYGAYDADNTHSAVLSVKVNGSLVGCSATMLSDRIALSVARCFLAAPTLTPTERAGCLRGGRRPRHVEVLQVLGCYTAIHVVVRLAQRGPQTSTRRPPEL